MNITPTSWSCTREQELEHRLSPCRVRSTISKQDADRYAKSLRENLGRRRARSLRFDLDNENETIRAIIAERVRQCEALGEFRNGRANSAKSWCSGAGSSDRSRKDCVSEEKKRPT